MKFALLTSLILFLAFATAITSAQVSPRCPKITVNGGGSDPTRDTWFSFTLKGLENYALNLKITWTLATSLFDPATVTIEGQGTHNASFILPGTYHSGTIMMTADVAGLPAGCPGTASESVSWDGPPDAIKIGEMQNTSAFDLKIVQRFRDELENNPSNQGYIFIAHPPITPPAQVADRERAVVNAIFDRSNRFHDRSRMTIVRMTSSRNITEFWRVPPGADNPVCEGCEPVRGGCPSIGIERGAGIVKAGDHVEFIANDRNNVGGLSFHWTVKNGKIERGQGTSTIRVLPATYFTRPVEASVRVRGLPEGCADTFEESYAVPCHPYLATSVDVSFWSEYKAVPWTSERKQLQGIFARGLRWQPEKIVYIEKGFPLNSTVRTRDAAINRIRNYVLRTLKIPRNKLYIRSRIGRSATRLYLVPSDAPVLDPNWKESCVQE